MRLSSRGCLREVWHLAILSHLASLVDYVRIVFHHLLSLFHHLRIHHVHHALELLVANLRSHLRLVLRLHQGWVGLHHIALSFELGVAHLAELLHRLLLLFHLRWTGRHTSHHWVAHHGVGRLGLLLRDLSLGLLLRVLRSLVV